jgi:hypothetical protein
MEPHGSFMIGMKSRLANYCCPYHNSMATRHANGVARIFPKRYADLSNAVTTLAPFTFASVGVSTMP